MTAVLAMVCGAPPALAEAPARVVSMNLCTDQLAMLLAAPGQLVSVSVLASDPLSSSMVDQAAAYPANRGGAEEVFLMRPDLVLAGTYTALGSVDLLRRLGVRVVQVPPVTSLDQVPEQILIVGQALGREDAARKLAADFAAGLAALAVDLPPATAALYYPNGYTTGDGTLANDVLAHTGFSNVGATAGLTGGGILPLERLVMARPQVVVTSVPYPGASRSEEILDHPALAKVREKAGISASSDADWVCGTPHILRAVAGMKAAREALE
ncbi:ABC transporter substrate-binding protein [Rhodobacter sp. Har01]|uniref:ABC transporter substrate-binding protein n=1 Tax=Rhodobacter sp. Har01 TaxID=2883999 RepID=UPI001D0883D8|nr:ABC transporter substrate-binding protein [Rhodobacter sp. Har01]MCB6178819.1 ABC transporter substrate-binding protein [Rhodobacter sp. Har01]